MSGDDSRQDRRHKNCRKNGNSSEAKLRASVVFRFAKKR